MIILFFGFDKLKTLCSLLFDEHYFEIFDHLPACLSKFRTESQKKVNLFLSLVLYSLSDYFLIHDWVEDKNFGILLGGVSKVISLLVLNLFQSKKGAFVDCFREFSQVVFQNH